MKKIKGILKKYPILKNRYFLTITIFVIWITFFDTNSIVYQISLNKEKKTILKKIKNYTLKVEKDKDMINKIKSLEGLEKLAREEYWMKKDNEDIYLIDIK